MKIINKLFVAMFAMIFVSLAFAGAVILPPVATIGAGPNPANLTSTITAIGIDLSGFGINYVRIFEDGVEVKECSSSTCVYVAVHMTPGVRSYYAEVADNKGGTATSTTINVDFQNSAPILNAIGTQTVNEGSLLTFAISGYDYNNDSLAYSASGLPAGATFNITDQTFAWTPTFAQNGSYSVTFTVSDGSLSDSEIVQIDVADVVVPDSEYPQWSSLTENPASGAEYLPAQTYEFNSTWSDNVAINSVWINFEGVDYSASGVGGAYSFSRIGLAAGTYNYEWFANDTSGNLNSTGALDYIVDQATPALSITFLPSNSVVNGTETNVTGFGCPSQLTCTLYRNGVAFSNPDIATLPIGTYTYVYNTTGNENYTSASASATLTITSVIIPASEYPQWSSLTEPDFWLEYSPAQTYEFNSTWSDNVAINSVWINFDGVNYTVAGVGGVYNFSISNLAAGTYSYEWFANDSDGNVNSTGALTYTLDKAEPDLWIDMNPAYSVLNGTETTVTGMACPAQLTCTLYRDDVVVSNPDVQNLSNGIYTYVYNTTGNENYTASSDEETLNVDDDGDSEEPDLISYSHSPASGTAYSPSQVYRFNSTWYDLDGLDDGALIISYFANLSAYMNSLRLYLINFSADVNDIGSYSDVQDSINDTIIYLNNFDSYNESEDFNEINVLLEGIFDNLDNYTELYDLSDSLDDYISDLFSGSSVDDFYIVPQTNGTYNISFTGLPVGHYVYLWVVLDLDGSAASLNNSEWFVVRKATPALSITLLPSNSVTIGNQTNATGLGCPSQLMCTLYRNGVAVNNSDVATLPVGTYTYVYNTTGNGNYTANSVSVTLTVAAVVSDDDGGSSGGSGGSDVKTVNSDDLTRGYTVSIDLNDKLKFVFCGSPYYIKLTDVNNDNDKATFLLTPGNKQFTLKEGVSERINLDLDSVDDILFRLENAGTDSAKVYIKKISNLCAGTKASSVNLTGENVEKLEPREASSNLVPIAGLLAFGIIISALGIIFYYLGALKGR